MNLAILRLGPSFLSTTEGVAVVGRKPVTSDALEYADRKRLGAYRRSFHRSAVVTLLQGAVPLALGAVLGGSWLTGALSGGLWWLAVVGALCLVCELVKTCQAARARRSSIHLFQAGLIAERLGDVARFGFDDVDLTRKARKQSIVQVVYSVQRRSDGRLLRLENVLRVEKLAQAILAGPDRGMPPLGGADFAVASKGDHLAIAPVALFAALRHEHLLGTAEDMQATRRIA